MHSQGLQHIEKRRRSHKKPAKFPHSNPKVCIFDKIILATAFITPLINIPQLAKILIDKSNAGVSIVTFGGFAIVNTLWFTYGVIHRQLPIIVLYALLFITNSAIVVGAIIYK